MTSTLTLRITLIAALFALLIAGIPIGSDDGRVWRLVGDDRDAASIASLLLTTPAPAAVLRDAGAEPTEPELQALADVARRAPLIVALTAEGPGLTATPPDAPRAGRYGAVGFTTYADPGDTVTARLLDARHGVLDSLRVVGDRRGSASGGFRVRPGREGWTDWGISVGAGPGGEMIRRVGAWVAPADPPRVLVVAGPPSWESRYVLRALERSGADVALVQRVGRENLITAGNAAADWGTGSALAAYDVVILLQDAAPDRDAVRSLEAWVAEGKGLAVASDGVVVGGSVARAPRQHRADALDWNAPAEIVPLPSADFATAASVVGPVAPGVTVAARTEDGDPLLTVGPFGRGRTAALGLRETWRWTMEAGLEAEHRAFWRSLVDWLAVPAADSLGVDAAPVEAEVGSTVDLLSRGTPLELRRPGAGGGEAVPYVADDSAWRGRFVAADPGLHEVRAAGAAVAAFRSRPPGDGVPAVLGRARLSLLAAASGGEALESDAFRARAEALAAAQDPRPWWPAAAFTLLVLLALTEWTLRRLRGLS